MQWLQPYKRKQSYVLIERSVPFTNLEKTVMELMSLKNIKSLLIAYIFLSAPAITHGNASDNFWQMQNSSVNGNEMLLTAVKCSFIHMDDSTGEQLASCNINATFFERKNNVCHIKHAVLIDEKNLAIKFKKDDFISIGKQGSAPQRSGGFDEKNLVYRVHRDKLSMKVKDKWIAIEDKVPSLFSCSHYKLVPVDQAAIRSL